MFVMNCTVDTGNPLEEAAKSEKHGTISTGNQEEEEEKEEKMDQSEVQGEEANVENTEICEEKKDEEKMRKTLAERRREYIKHGQEKGGHKRGKKQKPTKKSTIYLNVHCSICKTQVAMYDEEQVYHFFNILASHP